ncbi:hypothetical protein Lal_00007432 [Lupinus albus]|uniref:Putative encoded peptide n=1 Tax=Lupinus albus TaxID=3870 RepID=A0A6A5MND4_LUPAL|nr:putative encoded peptide [Lupinus albus]KAF1874817.1 hypothetical protein Lal_00007432 [Lupinus albus]
MAGKTILLTCLLFLIILQYNFGFVTPSRVLNLHPPAPPAPILRSPLPPLVDWYTKNDDNDGKGDAFRPTSPGHSPGVGHQTPPGAP